MNNEHMSNIKLSFTNDSPTVQPIISPKIIYDRFSEEKIEEVMSQKMIKEIEKALLSSAPASISPSEEKFTVEEMIEQAKRVKEELNKAHDSLNLNFTGEIMNIETITNVIKFIKAQKPEFEFQIILNAKGKFKEVRKILDVNIFDVGDYINDNQIYIIPKESPKYFTVKFE